MTTLKIIAVITVKPEFQETVLQILKAVTDGSRKEPGNIAYDLHQDTTNPLVYTLIEIWKSEEAIREHNQTMHYKTFKQEIAGKTDSIQVSVIKEIY